MSELGRFPIDGLGMSAEQARELVRRMNENLPGVWKLVEGAPLWTFVSTSTQSENIYYTVCSGAS